MKIGTFACWLWGHKFVMNTQSLTETYHSGNPVINLTQTDFCVRCGITKSKGVT